MNGFATACRTNQQKVEPDKNYYKKPEKRQLIHNNHYVELSVVRMDEPVYDEPTKSTRVKVVIVNTGNVASIETNAVLRDLDITVEDGKKSGLNKTQLKVIKENNRKANATDESGGNKNVFLKEGVDNDRDWEVFARLLPVKPGELVTVEFIIPDYWVYDPHCEMEVVIDADNNIEEKNEKNNISYFIKAGEK